MGGRGGGSSSSALGQALKKAAAAQVSGTGDPVLDMVIDVFRTSDRQGVRESQISSIFEMRKGLAARGMTSREEQDTELTRLFRKQDIHLFPLANQKILAPHERDHIFLGNEKKNGIMLASKHRNR